MKQIMTLLAVVLFGIHGFAQQQQKQQPEELKPDQVPTYIKERLQYKFPQTIEIPVAWTKDKTAYKAAITIMDAPAYMVIDSATGKTIHIERRLHEDYLPKRAKDYLRTLDPKFQILDVWQVTDDKEKITYKTAAKITTNFVFDGDGQVVGKK
jgi:hypothetical protein